MAVIKVSTSFFSFIKSISRAVQKATDSDEILVTAGTYKECLTFHDNRKITAKKANTVLIEGSIIISKSAKVTLENVTIRPSTQIFIEGHLILKNCVVQGGLSNVLLCLKGGKAHCTNSSFINASDVAVTMLHESEAHFEECYFEWNKKAHLLNENSKLYLTNCSLSNANHAIWVKSKAKAYLNNVQIHHQKGTQLIVQDESFLEAIECTINHGEGNGIYAAQQSKIQLLNTTIHHHTLPQLWIQNSELKLDHCQIQYGNESGIMLRERAEATISNSLIAFHKVANVQLTLESLLNMTKSEIYSCQGVGIQLKEKSIANFIDTVFENNVLTQLFVTENSICTLKEVTINEGKQIGIFTEKGASCSIVSSSITGHKNAAFTVMDAEVFMLDSAIERNNGNGIFAGNHAKVVIEKCRFTENDLTHIAGKNNSTVIIEQSEFIGGKSIFVMDHCQLEVIESVIKDGTGIQIELVGNTKATIQKSKISDGQTNGIKAVQDSTLQIIESQISSHKMPQICVNDSSVIFKNSELLKGERNGFIIENNAEAFIQDSFISNHVYPQIWIDSESSVELNNTQLTEGHESDIYVQNHSVVHASSCIIRNDKFNFNIQAVDFSKINLTETMVENSVGQKFYSKNNSQITYNLDEIS